MEADQEILVHSYQKFNQAIEATSQKSRMAGPSNFDIESFKKELLKEIGDDMRQMIKDMFAEVVEKTPTNEEDTKTRTILGEPLKEKLKAPANSTEPKWVKDMKRQMD